MIRYHFAYDLKHATHSDARCHKQGTAFDVSMQGYTSLVHAVCNNQEAAVLILLDLQVSDCITYHLLPSLV